MSGSDIAENSVPGSVISVPQVPKQDLATDFDTRPVEISRAPIARNRNPAHQHLLAQASEASRSSKRHLMNTLAKMLGAPDVQPKSNPDDKRVRDFEGLAYPYEYVCWETLSLDGYRAIVQMIANEPLDPNEQPLRYRSPATVNAYVAALRGIVREAWIMELISHDLLDRFRSIKPTKMKQLPKGKAQHEDVINALLLACDVKTARGARDASILAIMVLTGLRRSEALRIYISDIDFNLRQIKIRGKGRKERLILVPDAAWEYLEHWLNHRTCEAGPLYVGIRNNVTEVRSLSKPLSLHSLNARLKVICSVASSSVDIKFEVTPHHLRHTFATDLYKAGVDLITIQMLMNHANLETTRGYIRAEEEEARKKAAAINANRFSLNRRDA